MRIVPRGLELGRSREEVEGKRKKEKGGRLAMEMEKRRRGKRENNLVQQ